MKPVGNGADATLDFRLGVPAMSLDSLVREIGKLFQKAGGLTEPPLLLRDGGVEGRFGDLCLSSVFRRIRSASNPSRVDGLQACLRVYAEGESPASALDVFAAAQDTVAVINLDRLCRTLHLLNYLAVSREAAQLFLYANPHHVTGVKKNHGAYFEDILSRCGLAPERVVICVALGLSGGSRNPALLQGLANYRARGYRLALQSNTRSGFEAVDFEFVRSVRPDYLLLPHGFGSVPQRAEIGERLARLRSLIVIAHGVDARVVADGIETAAQAELSLAAGADLVRGDYFEAPRHSRFQPDEQEPEVFQNRAISRGSAEYADWQRSESSTLGLLGRRWQYS